MSLVDDENWPKKSFQSLEMKKTQKRQQSGWMTQSVKNYVAWKAKHVFIVPCGKKNFLGMRIWNKNDLWNKVWSNDLKKSYITAKWVHKVLLPGIHLKVFNILSFDIF